MGIFIIKIHRYRDCRIFITGIPVHEKKTIFILWRGLISFFSLFRSQHFPITRRSWQQNDSILSGPDTCHDDFIKWKSFQRYWPLVRGIHRSPVDSPQKGQWHGALMFSLLCAWINDWANNGDAAEFKTLWRYLWRHCNADPMFGRYFIRLIGHLTLIRWIFSESHVWIWS